MSRASELKAKFVALPIDTALRKRCFDAIDAHVQAQATGSGPDQIDANAEVYACANAVNAWAAMYKATHTPLRKGALPVARKDSTMPIQQFRTTSPTIAVDPSVAAATLPAPLARRLKEALARLEIAMMSGRKGAESSAAELVAGVYRDIEAFRAKDAENTEDAAKNADVFDLSKIEDHVLRGRVAGELRALKDAANAPNPEAAKTAAAGRLQKILEEAEAEGLTKSVTRNLFRPEAFTVASTWEALMRKSGVEPEPRTVPKAGTGN